MQTDPGTSPNHIGELSLSARLVLFALAIFLLDSACVVVANLSLQSVHLFEWFYGPEQVEAARGPGGDVLHTRMTLWAAALAFPFWVACVVLLVRRLKLVAAADVGLTLRNPARNLLLGCATAVILTPLVLGLNIGAAEFFARTLGFAPTEHPLTAAGKEGLFPAEWVLVAFLVMVSAPVREELLFRGVLQRLFAERAWASHVAVGLALLTALVSCVLAITRQPPNPSPVHGGLSLLSALMPALFVFTMVPVYLALWWRSTTACVPPKPGPAYPDVEPTDADTSKGPQAPAVFASALLFGATHSFAWPTPIALFALGLGLGYLALRTRSLVAPVVVHCLFNGASFVLLVTGWAS
jgi:membrane protease YdiL (CAAX protease family)